MKSRGQSSQRPYVTFESTAKFNRGGGTVDGRKAGLFRLDDARLRELLCDCKLLEANRRRIQQLVDG